MSVVIGCFCTHTQAVDIVNESERPTTSRSAGERNRRPVATGDVDEGRLVDHLAARCRRRRRQRRRKVTRAGNGALTFDYTVFFFFWRDELSSKLRARGADRRQHKQIDGRLGSAGRRHGHGRPDPSCSH